MAIEAKVSTTPQASGKNIAPTLSSVSSSQKHLLCALVSEFITNVLDAKFRRIVLLFATLPQTQPDGEGEPSRKRLIDAGLATPYNEEITIHDF